MASLKICYDKLWIMLINKKMSKQQLRRLSGISSATLTKLYRDEPVSVDVLLRLCEVLECDVGDICAARPAPAQNAPGGTDDKKIHGAERL